MSKIWEITFTSFSGSSAVAYDNVGTQHLVNPNNITIVNPVQGFTFRPGVAFTLTDVRQYYDLVTPSAITNAYWVGSWTRRSFVVWGYFPDTTSGSFWDGNNGATIWASFQNLGDEIPDIGLYRSGAGKFVVAINDPSNNLPVLVPASGTATGWHLLIFTFDKTLPQSKFYIDKVLVASGSTAINTTTSKQMIGESATGREGSYQLGYVATYDHILSQAEINAIYDTFLIDAVVDPSFQSLSGVVYSLSGTTQSGSKVYAIYQPTDIMVSKYTTSGDGYYYLNLPYSGAYTVVASTSPQAGARATSIIATSSGVFPVT